MNEPLSSFMVWRETVAITTPLYSCALPWSDLFLAESYEQAQHLSYHKKYRCICVDVAGRGFSDRLLADEYGYPSYISDLVAVISSLGPVDQLPDVRAWENHTCLIVR